MSSRCKNLAWARKMRKSKTKKILRLDLDGEIIIVRFCFLCLDAIPPSVVFSCQIALYHRSRHPCDPCLLYRKVIQTTCLTKFCECGSSSRIAEFCRKFFCLSLYESIWDVWDLRYHQDRRCKYISKWSSDQDWYLFYFTQRDRQRYDVYGYIDRIPKQSHLQWRSLQSYQKKSSLLVRIQIYHLVTTWTYRRRFCTIL